MKERSIKTEEDVSDASDRLLLRGDGKTEDNVPMAGEELSQESRA